jgi:hypothetical protein
VNKEDRWSFVGRRGGRIMFFDIEDVEVFVADEFPCWIECVERKERILESFSLFEVINQDWEESDK